MAKIEIYTTARCPYCARAKALLDRKGLGYMEIRIDEEPEKRDEMLSQSEGRQTVPQIFINARGIGGFDELWELEQSKKLGELLKT